MRTGWWDFLDPFSWLGDQVADAVTGIWTMMMMALWNSGLWVLRLEFAVIDALTTPDLSEDGPWCPRGRLAGHPTRCRSDPPQR